MPATMMDRKDVIVSGPPSAEPPVATGDPNYPVAARAISIDGRAYRVGELIDVEHRDHWMVKGVAPPDVKKPAPGSIADPRSEQVDGPARDPADAPASTVIPEQLDMDAGNRTLAAAGSDTSERVALPEPKSEDDKAK